MPDTNGFFNYFFNNARFNGVLILDREGTILKVNKAFSTMFGYDEHRIVGTPFQQLFTETDRRLGKPNEELVAVLANGSANDDNYLVNADGTASWVTGESVLCKNDADKEYIVKVIHNIQLQKLLEQMLLESNELVDSIFHSITDVGLLLLDIKMRAVKANDTFFRVFDLEPQALEGVKLADLPNAFWQDEEVRRRLREMVITNDYFSNKTFSLQPYGISKSLAIYVKPLDSHAGHEKRILLVIRELELFAEASLS